MSKTKINTASAEQPTVLKTSEINLLMDFYSLKKTIEEMNKDLIEKKDKVTEFLKNQPGLKFSIGEGDDGIGFSLRSTPIYKFSETVDSLELNAKQINEKIKEIKNNEIKSGEAKLVNTQYAVCTK